MWLKPIIIVSGVFSPENCGRKIGSKTYIYIPLECISTTLYIFICNAFVPEVLFNAYHFQIIAT